MSFVLEDGSGAEYEGTNLDLEDVVEREKEYPASIPEDDEDFQAPVGTFDYFAHEDDARQGDHAAESADHIARNQDMPWPCSQGAALGIDFSSPASIAELTQRDESISYANPLAPLPGAPFGTSNSTATSPATSLPTPRTVPRLKFSRREAFLLHHFVQKIATWVCSPTFSMVRG